MSQRIVGAVCSALLLAGCGVSKDEFAAAQRDAAANQQKYQEEAKKNAALEKKVADLQAQNVTLTQSTTELEAKSKQYEELAGSLKDQIQNGQVELSELKGKMTVKLKDRVVFSSGSAAINKQGQEALAAVAKAFQGLQGKNVIVAGYTDNVPVRGGPFKDNWDLSTARAVSVVRYLQTQGVEPKMLGAAGFSEYRPLAPNDTAEGRSQNRRIEIALTAADYTPPVVDMPAAR